MRKTGEQHWVCWVGAMNPSNLDAIADGARQLLGSPLGAIALFSRQVDAQAVMRATNDFYAMATVLMLGSIFVVWLIKRPKGHSRPYHIEGLRTRQCRPPDSRPSRAAVCGRVQRAVILFSRRLPAASQSFINDASTNAGIDAYSSDRDIPIGTLDDAVGNLPAVVEPADRTDSSLIGRSQGSGISIR